MIYRNYTDLIVGLFNSLPFLFNMSIININTITVSKYVNSGIRLDYLCIVFLINVLTTPFYWYVNITL